MTYKTLSTVALADGADALEAALACAYRFDAHLDVTCLSPGQLDLPAMIDPYMVASGALLIENTIAELDAIDARVRERLRPETISWAVIKGTAQTTDGTRGVATAQRMADLAVLPLPGRAARMDRQMILEAMLYHSRVPILLAPDDRTCAFDRVMIGWDGSDVALAAVRAALPMMQMAKDVEIVTIDPHDATAGHDLAIFLGRHDIKSTVSAIPRSGARIDDVLAEHARDRKVDLMVMGAYGAGRLRETLLGGVTKRLLEDARVPLFMAR